MQLPSPGHPHNKAIQELLHSRQSVQQEELQIGQLAVEVIKLCKEAEAARLEVLALDKELQISLLLGRLVKLLRGLSVRLERFQVMAIVWERHKMLPAELR
jgi:hypothetical protein